MEAAHDAVARVGGLVSLARFFVSLSISWRIWQARDSSVVAFIPLAADVIELYAWLLCGIATRHVGMTRFYAFGLALMTFNATVHRLYSSWTGPGLALIAALLVITTASSEMTTAGLIKVTRICALLARLAPVVRILTCPLPEMAAFALVLCGLRTLLGVIDGDVWDVAWNIPGTIVAAVEVGVTLGKGPHGSQLLLVRHDVKLLQR
ncbi:hypothetical protein HPB50_023700 [Hyalomma asiaticum]|uniref:Uncharacterized protein n=1 Tax=Hyalomma asiaticum TaxID=266040 RepID=A0ACB7T6L4_HYAAI|nr:hypothetical protein HPB50_023700 [Hyalomma asiaticum]